MNDVDPLARRCISSVPLLIKIGHMSGIGEPSWNCHWPPTFSDSIHTWIIVLLATDTKRYPNHFLNFAFNDFFHQFTINVHSVYHSSKEDYNMYVRHSHDMRKKYYFSIVYCCILITFITYHDNPRICRTFLGNQS